MPSTPVRSRSSVVTKPRSRVTPASAYPRPSVTGPRPTATRSRSASIESPPSSETVTVSPLWVAPAKRTPVFTAILRLRNERSSCLLIASSSAATSRGSASTTVTSEPNERNTEANSTPMTPPPRTTTRGGTKSIARACSLVMMRPPISRPGSDLGYEPVARTTLRPRTARPPTSTVERSTRRPSPSTISIWWALARPCSPLYRRAMTPSLYALTPDMSTDSKVDFTPKRSPSRAVSATSAAWSSALVGMQPTCRQVPPSLCFSTRATRRPSSAARNAQA